MFKSSEDPSITLAISIVASLLMAVVLVVWNTFCEDTLLNAIAFVFIASCWAYLIFRYASGKLKTGQANNVEQESTKTSEVEITFPENLSYKSIDLSSLAGNLHSLIHRARDCGIRTLPKTIFDEHSPKRSDFDILNNSRNEITKLLSTIANIFDDITPKNVKIWSALRVRNINNEFYTFERAGSYSPVRRGHSKPLPVGSPFVNYLWDQYRVGQCVIFDKSGKLKEIWDFQDSDYLKEDLSILAGAVVNKATHDLDDLSENPAWVGNDIQNLSWILYVNASERGIFNEEYRDLMKSFVDIFSWLLNSMHRHQRRLEKEASY